MALSTLIFRRGETVRRRLTVQLQDGTPKDLTGASVAWNLIDLDNITVFPSNKAIGSGVVFEGAPSQGKLIVTMTSAETAALGQSAYDQEWVITDSAGDVEIYRGSVSVLISTLPAAA